MDRRSFAQALGGAAVLSAFSAKASRIPAPDNASAGKIMAVAAHPGDGLFTMGAVLAQQVERGGAGVLLNLSLGERGAPKNIPVQRYGEMQRDATEKAARLLRFETFFLSYPDGEVPFDEESSLRVCDAIREHKPNVILTHWIGSEHKDHRNCYLIVRDAVFFAGLMTLERSRPAHSVSKLFFPENWEDADKFVPDTYLDIESIYDKWLQACDFYPMWRGQTGFFRYNDYYSSLAIARGCLSGFKQAVALMAAEGQRAERLQML